MLHLFLISSPLQVITAENIRLQYLNELEEGSRAVIFLEGERLINLVNNNRWSQVIVGKNTRPSTDDAKRNIQSNLELIKNYLQTHRDQKIILYVSELYWLFNNIVCTYLQKQYSANVECCYMDEGMILYKKSKLLWKDQLRLVLKYMWMKWHQFPAKLLLQTSWACLKHANRVYCYHPAILKQIIVSPTDQAKIIALNPGALRLDQLPSQVHASTEKTVLFLSQPYYRVMPIEKYEQVIAQLVMDFKSNGYTEFFIKPHDADDKVWLKKISDEHGFKPYKLEKTVPIESLAANLTFDAIVSVCSSALLNLKLFGYQGEVISYGMEKCELSKQIKIAHDEARFAYGEVGVRVL